MSWRTRKKGTRNQIGKRFVSYGDKSNLPKLPMRVIPKIEDIPYYPPEERAKEKLIDEDIRQALLRGEYPDVQALTKKYAYAQYVRGKRIPMQGEPMDEGIVPLLIKMTRKGYSTVGSCQGHMVVGTWDNAFVNFRASSSLAEHLNDVTEQLGDRLKITYRKNDNLYSLEIVPSTNEPEEETKEILKKVESLL